MQACSIWLQVSALLQHQLHRVMLYCLARPDVTCCDARSEGSRALRLAEGVQIELAYLTGAFELWFSILVAATWVLIATIRAHDFLQGLINSVLFAIIIIIGMSARGYVLWHTVRTPPCTCCINSMC